MRIMKGVVSGSRDYTHALIRIINLQYLEVSAEYRVHIEVLIKAEV